VLVVVHDGAEEFGRDAPAPAAVATGTGAAAVRVRRWRRRAARIVARPAIPGDVGVHREERDGVEVEDGPGALVAGDGVVARQAEDVAEAGAREPPPRLMSLAAVPVPARDVDDDLAARGEQLRPDLWLSRAHRRCPSPTALDPRFGRERPA
jgi:hypothetical protein